MISFPSDYGYSDYSSSVTVCDQQVTYVTADHLGSGNLLLNSSGTTLINESYSAYGYRRSSNWSGPLSASSGDYTTISSTTRRDMRPKSPESKGSSIDDSVASKR